MLNNEVKRNIDSLRDTLVGKVPDPKAQVEQITIALIYKFMNDMDEFAKDLGGEASFFAYNTDEEKDYSRYGWRKIMSPENSGEERVRLYMKGIEKMNTNPHLPQLFRDIFRGAFLPYRDPETLHLFLKGINAFSYNDSENLGDAFEYLLSVLGSQGDAGQFRTPRHIIDMMVDVVNPQKNQTVLDPACGTAGFLISAYKHILEQNKETLMTPDEQKKLLTNFTGYDISPDMVRISRVNMYLHRFPDPHIYEYDTLTSEDRWNDRFDIILANPPFMTPKGGIRPHHRFSVQANRSEVLFVDYIAEHLNPGGRAAVIVPEGIVFQSANAYKQLRKFLVDSNYLYCVVSLPAGVFNPYSGVKTNILFFDKKLAQKADSILFVTIKNDGFDLGAQRREISGDELPWAAKLIKKYQLALQKSQAFDMDKYDQERALTVEKKRLSEHDYVLTGDRYREVATVNSNYPMVELGEVLDYEQPTNYIVESIDYDDSYSTPVLTAGQTFILGYTNEEKEIFDNPLPVIIFDDFTAATKIVDFPFKVKSSAMKILKADSTRSNIKYLFHTIQNIKFDSSIHKRYWISEFSKIQIPLPSLSAQQKIVEEIEGYQRIIDGARMVVENYKPTIKIDPSWKMVMLGDVCEITSSKRIFQDEYVPEGIPFYRTKEIVELSKGEPLSLELFISKERYNKLKNNNPMPKKNDILLSAVGTIGISWVIADDRNFYFKDGNIVWIKQSELIDSLFLKCVLDSTLIDFVRKNTFGAAYTALTIVALKTFLLPLPPLTVQQQIVDRISEEMGIVEQNKKLIALFEQKVKDKISEVWGE